MIRLILLLVFLFIIGHGLLEWAQMPVYEWCEEGTFEGHYALFHCASPTYWDKWTNSPEWQRWEKDNPFDNGGDK